MNDQQASDLMQEIVETRAQTKLKILFHGYLNNYRDVAKLDASQFEASLHLIKKLQIDLQRIDDNRWHLFYNATYGKKDPASVDAYEKYIAEGIYSKSVLELKKDILKRLAIFMNTQKVRLFEIMVWPETELLLHSDPIM